MSGLASTADVPDTMAIAFGPRLCENALFAVIRAVRFPVTLRGI